MKKIRKKDQRDQEEEIIMVFGLERSQKALDLISQPEQDSPVQHLSRAQPAASAQRLSHKPAAHYLPKEPISDQFSEP